MILFFIIATALVAIALLMLLPPLFRGAARQSDQALVAELKKKAESAKTDQEREAISAELLAALEQHDNPDPENRNPLVPLLVAFFVPILAIGMYLQLGSPALINLADQAPTGPAAQEEGPSIGELISKLEQSLADNPNNSEGWYLLARTLMSTQEFDKAATAMGKVIELEGEEDPNLLVQYADALSMAAQGKLLGKPLSYVEKALTLNPDLPEALWMRGLGYAQAGQLAEAVTTWKKAARLLGDRPEAQAELRQMIADTELKLTKGSGGATQPAMPPPATATGASVSVNVSLAPDLAASVKPENTVFIFARAVSGPPMPLAAQKLSVSDLPATVTLDDSQAMMPNMTLSAVDNVVVGARISLSGEPVARPGDLESQLQQIKASDTDSLNLVIDRVH